MTEDRIWKRLEALKGDPNVQLSPKTQRVYATFWRGFAEWCGKHGYDPLPASPAVVCHHLMDRAEEGIAASTLKAIRNSIASKHKLAGLESPTMDKRVKETLSTLSLRHRRTREASKQAVPIRAEHLKALANKYDADDILKGRVSVADYLKYVSDRALVFTMYAGLLRAAEAAALRWSDIREQEDGKALVTIRKSKTSLTPEVICITASATGALNALRKTAEPVDPEARVFGIKTPRGLHNRIVRAMKGIRKGVSGHSCRVGAAQDLTIAGVPLQAVQRAGRWKSLSMPSHYASRVDAKQGAVNALENLLS